MSGWSSGLSHIEKIISEGFLTINRGHVAICRTIYKDSFRFLGMDVFVVL